MNGSALASFARAFYGEKKKHISTDITRRKEKKNNEIKIAEEETVSNPREFMHAT